MTLQLIIGPRYVTVHRPEPAGTTSGLWAAGVERKEGETVGQAVDRILAEWRL